MVRVQLAGIYLEVESHPEPGNVRDFGGLFREILTRIYGDAVTFVDAPDLEQREEQRGEDFSDTLTRRPIALVTVRGKRYAAVLELDHYMEWSGGNVTEQQFHELWFADDPELVRKLELRAASNVIPL